MHDLTTKDYYEFLSHHTSLCMDSAKGRAALAMSLHVWVVARDCKAKGLDEDYAVHSAHWADMATALGVYETPEPAETTDGVEEEDVCILRMEMECPTVPLNNWFENSLRKYYESLDHTCDKLEEEETNE